MADPSDFFLAILELFGVSTDRISERSQVIAFLALLIAFGVATGCFTEGLTSLLWFGVAGVSSLLLALAIWWRA